MTAELLLRYVHFVCVLAIAGALTAEHVLLKPTLTRAEIARLAVVDAFYGVAALLLLAAGLTLWLGGFGKAAEFYSRNPLFHAKLTCFVFLGLLSVYPTVFFLKNRKGDPAASVAVPRAVILLLRLELLLLLILPLLAGLMARGVGLY
jgi:putative membrane protein